jgi:RecA/RadA recombinase
MAYILGVLSSATYTRKGVLELRHKSYHFITQLQAFLLNDGIPSTVLFDTRHNMQVLHISSKYIWLLKNCQASGLVPSNTQLGEILKTNFEGETPERFIYEPVRRVWKSRIGLPVYDIEMPDTHMYMANNFYSHNSYFMYELLSQAQQIYKPTVGIIVDREGAYYPKRGEQIGIDNSLVVQSQPRDTPLPRNAVDFIETSINWVRKHKKEGEEPKIIVLIDSLASFDKDVSRDKSDMGKGAQAWHEAFRDILNFMDKDIMVLFSNHVTYKPTIYGDNRTKSGGEAGNYYRSCGLALSRKLKIVDSTKGNEVIGDRIYAVVDKTRRGPAFREVILPIYYDNGVPIYGGYLWMLASRGIITPSNKDDFKKGKGRLYKYTKGDQTFSFVEGRELQILEKFPELIFDKYPDYHFEETANVDTDDSNGGSTCSEEKP